MYRIVHNELTGVYRIERHGLLGWSFVTHPSTRDYLGFRTLAKARRWVCRHSRHRGRDSRRWKVVSDCET